MTTLISNCGVRFMHGGCGETDIEIHSEVPTKLPMRQVCEDLIGLLSDARATEDLLRLQELVARKLEHSQRPEPGVVPSLEKSA